MIDGVTRRLDKDGFVADARSANLEGPFYEKDVPLIGPDGLVAALNYAVHIHTRAAAVDARTAMRRMCIVSCIIGVLFGCVFMYAAGLIFFHPVSALTKELHEAAAASQLLKEMQKK